MQTAPARPDRTLVGILALIAVLVIVAVVVVFTRGAPEPLEDGTPERAVQEYATAVVSGDLETAAGLLAPTWKDNCQDTGYDVAATDVRLTLIGTQLHGKTATVTVSVTTGFNSGPFGGSGYEYEDTFQLDRHGEGWLIANVPWDLAFCPMADLS